MTGEPYIYGGANPITYGDPTGLCSTDMVLNGCKPSQGTNYGDTGRRGGSGAGGEPPSIPDSLRQRIAGNPSVLENHLSKCWYVGFESCDGLTGTSHFDAETMDLAKFLLLGYLAQGAFTLDGDALVSPHQSNPRGVTFTVAVDDTGAIIVVTNAAEPTSFREMLSGGLAVVGTALTILELGGLAACPFTAGGGCAFAGGAGALNVAVGVADAGATCSGGATASCGWSIGSTAINIAAGYGAGQLDTLLALRGQGEFMQVLMGGVVDYGVRGVFEVHNDEFDVHQYGIVL